MTVLIEKRQEKKGGRFQDYPPVGVLQIRLSFSTGGRQ